MTRVPASRVAPPTNGHYRPDQRDLYRAVGDLGDPFWGDPPWPAKFTAFTAAQQHAILEIHEVLARGRDVLLEGPTGSGKTVVAEATRRAFRADRGVYLCSRKSLQDQMAGDFPDAAVLKGRRNYPTRDFPAAFHLPTRDPDHVSCGDCNRRQRRHCAWNAWTEGDDAPTTCMVAECHPLTWARCCTWCTPLSECPYGLAKSAALDAELAVLNTAYFGREANHAGAFSHRDLAILDEADLAEDQLRNLAAVELSARDRETLALGPLRSGPIELDTIAWCMHARAQAEKAIQVARRADPHDDIPRHQREIKHWTRLSAALTHIIKRGETDTGVVVEHAETRGVEFKPILVDDLARRLWWRHATQWMLMSATLLNAERLMGDLGRPPDGSWSLVTMASTFDPARRPIYYVPVANVTRARLDEAVPALANEIRQLVALCAHERIVVHTSSYALQGLLRPYLDGPRYVWPRTARELDAALTWGGDYHRTPNAILIGPGMERGLDLADDLCRMVIIAKVPYASLADPQVKARQRLDHGQDWYEARAMRALIQSSGRGMRHAEDWCSIHILDHQFTRLARSQPPPAWWTAALHA